MRLAEFIDWNHSNPIQIVSGFEDSRGYFHNLIILRLKPDIDDPDSFKELVESQIPHPYYVFWGYDITDRPQKYDLCIGLPPYINSIAAMWEIVGDILNIELESNDIDSLGIMWVAMYRGNNGWHLCLSCVNSQYADYIKQEIARLGIRAKSQDMKTIDVRLQLSSDDPIDAIKTAHKILSALKYQLVGYIDPPTD